MSSVHMQRAQIKYCNYEKISRHTNVCYQLKHKKTQAVLYLMYLLFLLVRKITKCIDQSYETADRHELVRCSFYCNFTSVRI